MSRDLEHRVETKAALYGTIWDNVFVVTPLLGRGKKTLRILRGGTISPLMIFIWRSGKYGIKQFTSIPSICRQSVMTPFLNFHEISPKPNKWAQETLGSCQETVWENPIGCSALGCTYMPDGIVRTRHWENASKAAQARRQAEHRKGTSDTRGRKGHTMHQSGTIWNIVLYS